MAAMTSLMIDFMMCSPIVVSIDVCGSARTEVGGIGGIGGW